MRSQLSRLRYSHLGRLLAIALLTVMVCIGGIGLANQRAIAAATPEAKAYDAGPIRQTRNPLSNENFQGGVDRTAIDQKGRNSLEQPEEEDTGIVGALKDLLPGNYGDESEPSPRSDFQPEKNPTLKRYTTQD